MQYCINFSKDFRHLHEVDEVILKCSGGEQIMESIQELFQEHKNQRIIFDILTIDYDAIIPFISKLRADGYNIKVRIYDLEKPIDKFKEMEIPFFFHIFPKGLEDIYIQCEKGVSDIYITQELGFRIKDLQYFRETYGVKFRVIPNIAQSANKHYINGMQRFWVRPEDTELYEPYVDVFELLGGLDLSSLSVVYEIYKERQWLGNLNDIILDFKEPIVSNRGINPHFAEMRLNCGKKCLLNRCNLCSQTASLSDAFVDAGIEIIKPRFIQITPEEEEKVIAKIKEIYNESRFDTDIDNT